MSNICLKVVGTRRVP